MSPADQERFTWGLNVKMAILLKMYPVEQAIDLFIDSGKHVKAHTGFSVLFFFLLGTSKGVRLSNLMKLCLTFKGTRLG